MREAKVLHDGYGVIGIYDRIAIAVCMLGIGAADKLDSPILCVVRRPDYGLIGTGEAIQSISYTYREQVCIVCGAIVIGIARPYGVGEAEERDSINKTRDAS